MTTGTSRRRANSSASWLAISPAPTTPTLVTVAGQRLVRRAGRPLGPPLHQVEGVQAGAQLLAHDQVGERLVLGGECRRRGRRSLAAAISSSARYGAGRRAVQPCWSASSRPRATAASQAVASVDLRARRPSISPVTTRPAQRSDSLQEVGRLEQRVGDAELDGLRPARASGSGSAGSRRSTVTRVVGADQVRQQLGAAPAGTRPRKHLGQRERRHAARTGSGSGSAARARGRRPAPRR